MNLGSERRVEKFVKSVVDISTDQYQEMWDGGSAPPDLGADLHRYLPMLPDLEAEICWLMVEKRKSQKDIAVLLGVTPATVGYRCRRAMDKLMYLMVVSSVDVKEMLKQIPFMKEKEREVVADLFYTAHQDLTGRKFGMRQSSVKWIFVKTKRRLEALERTDEKWTNYVGLMFLLERNLRVKVTL